MPIFLVIIVIIVVFLIAKLSSEATERKNREITRKNREDAIYKKYGADIARRIVEKTIWVGETKEQLLDSLGSPVDTDEEVLKTKKKEVWKYGQRSATRYRYKIKIENDIVVGWEEK